MEKSFLKLSKTLSTNQTIKELYFESHHLLDDFAVISILGALYSHPTLTKLSIRQSQPNLAPVYFQGRRSEAGVTAMTKLLYLNRKIRDVNFDHYVAYLTDKSAIDLMRAFLTNPVLNNLQFGGDARFKFPKKLQRDIYEALSNPMTKDFIDPADSVDPSKGSNSQIRTYLTIQQNWIQNFADLVNKYNKEASEKIGEQIISTIHKRLDNCAASASMVLNLTNGTASNLWLPSTKASAASATITDASIATTIINVNAASAATVTTKNSK